MFGPLDAVDFLLRRILDPADTQTQNRGCSRDVVTSSDAKMKSWQQLLQMATILDCNHVSCVASEEQKRDIAI